VQQRVGIVVVDDDALDVRSDAKHAARAGSKVLLTINLHLELAANHSAHTCLSAVLGELGCGTGGYGVRRDRDVLGEANSLFNGDMRGQI